MRKVKENPRLSAKKIADEVATGIRKACSASTIHRVLRSHDFHGRVPLKKPFVSLKNKSSRLAFATSHISKGPDFWNTVIFSDESKFNIFGSDGRS